MALPETSYRLRDLVRFAVPLTAILFVLASLPYVYGFWSSPPDKVFTGMMFDVPDHAQYWSWVTASQASLFISNTMTPEPNAPIFLNPMMWVLARVQLLLHLSFPALLQFWRVLATVAVVPAVLAFTRVFVTDPARRPVAMFVALCGSGFGWTLIVVKALTHSIDPPWPTTIYTVEPNTFWALLSYPYLSLAHALMLGIFTGVWLAWRRGMRAAAIVAIVCALTLSGTHAYDLITVYAVLGLLVFNDWAMSRRFPARLAGIVVLVGLASGPTALYYQQLTSNDPLWRAVLAQYSNAGVWTPPLHQLPWLMGLPLLLAPLSMLTTSWSDERRFLAIWAAAGALLIYLPVVYQIKLLSGWQFPLALLAADAWHDGLRPLLQRARLRTVGAIAGVVLVAGTNAYLFTWRFVDLRRHSAPYYLERDEVTALAWLAEHSTPGDLVLAREDIGRFVPNYGRTRSFLAHWAMTNRYFERRDLVTRFFDPVASDDSWRDTVVKDNRITFVIDTGAAESSALRSVAMPFELAFETPMARIFRVKTTPPLASSNALHP